MQIMKMILTCVIAFAATSLQAIQLKFVPGSEAAYRLVDTMSLDAKPFISGKFKKQMEIEIKLLSANEGNFPFEVQYQLNQIKLSQYLKHEDSDVDLTYDSAAPEANSRNAIVEKCLAPLIGSPLVFIVNKDENGLLTVVETSGRLAEFENNWNREEDLWEDNTDEPFFQNCIDKNEIDGFFEQLFHLAGEELEKGSKHDVRFTTYVDTDDDGGELIVNVDQSGSYTIDQISSPFIKGSLKGKITVVNNGKGFKSEQKVLLDGDVKWNAKNALIQHRTLRADLKQKSTDGRFKASLDQKWTPISK